MWTFGAVQLHVMIVVAAAAAARGGDALLGLPSWRALSTWVGTDAGCRLLSVVCEYSVKGLSWRHPRRRGGGHQKARAVLAPRDLRVIIRGVWDLAVL